MTLANIGFCNDNRYCPQSAAEAIMTPFVGYNASTMGDMGDGLPYLSLGSNIKPVSLAAGYACDRYQAI